MGPSWSVAFTIALGGALVLPMVVLLRQASPLTSVLAVGHAGAGAATLVVAFVLFIQSTVVHDPRLRWMAAGYALLLPVVVARALSLEGLANTTPTAGSLQSSAALSLVWQLVVPVFALTVWAARRPRLVLALPVILLAGAWSALVLGPELLTAPGHFTPLDRTLLLGTGAAAGLAALVWLRTTPQAWVAPWGWVSASLCLSPMVGLVRSLSTQRYDGIWWASLGVELLVLALPALGLGWQGMTGYFRQAHRWRILEQQVRALRASSALLPGRSITPEDESGLPGRLDVLDLVRRGDTGVALQPVVELSSGRVIGHEALARFGGRTPTDRWFRAASRHGLGPVLEHTTLAAALRLLDGLAEPAFLAVNVSPAALQDADVLALLHAAPLHRVVVEVTEHEAVADYPLARAALAGLRAAGARIAVDDTGAGFASLRHVLMLQPDIIKLDTTLISEIEGNARQRALVGALLVFASSVGTEVLAEGIETEAQLEALRSIGVRIGQGWHLGVPELCR